jgi:hypothetical protein
MRSKEFEDIEFIEPLTVDVPLANLADSSPRASSENSSAAQGGVELVRLSPDGGQIEFIDWNAIKKAAKQFDIGQKDSVRMIAKILFLFGSIDTQLDYARAELAAWKAAYPDMDYDGQTIVRKEDA